ncbi:putative membrane protein [Novosphingobium sp. PhB165]|uniref:YidH family protein n=1 Tax=Novosphingobium sp. PhB165 TaxID=2485105 RepID=UPI001045D813|nr:DUF202 domain-containing protein [Novosphingobium sp. PhB165]TCM21419.1 putative membrane protein [Novosphingobium sp. PhB165]
MTERPEGKLAGEIVEDAHKVARNVEKQTDTADRRTVLAADRTILAAERTYAAWVRTGLGALASGIGARALLQGVVSEWLVLTTTVALLLFSEFCFIAGIWRELRPMTPAPESDTPRLPAALLVGFNGFLVVLGIAVIVGILSK